MPVLKGPQSTFQDMEGVIHDLCFKNGSPDAEIWRCQLERDRRMCPHHTPQIKRASQQNHQLPPNANPLLSYPHPRDMISLSVIKGEELYFRLKTAFIPRWARKTEVLQVPTVSKSWQWAETPTVSFSDRIMSVKSPCQS